MIISVIYCFVIIIEKKKLLMGLFELMLQVMSDLFVCLGDNMWTQPLECAISNARLEELALIRKVDKLQSGNSDDVNAKSSLSDLSSTVKQEPLLLSRSDNSVTKPGEVMSNKGSNLIKAENKRLSFSLDESKRDSIGSFDGDRMGDQELDEEELTTLEVAFEPEKCVCCSIENGQTLVHSVAGKGYGVASAPISSGCYQLKVSLF